MLGLILASEHLERIIDRGPSAQEDGTLCFLGTHSDFARFLHGFSKADCDSATICFLMFLLPVCFLVTFWARQEKASQRFRELWGAEKAELRRFKVRHGLWAGDADDVLTCWPVDYYSVLQFRFQAWNEYCMQPLSVLPDMLLTRSEFKIAHLAWSGSKHFPGWKHPGVCGLDKATKWSQCGIPQAASRSILDQLSVVPSEKRSCLSGRVELAFSPQKNFEFFVKRTPECSFWCCWWFMLVFSQLLPKQNGSARVLGVSIFGPYCTHWNMSVSDQHLQSASQQVSLWMRESHRGRTKPFLSLKAFFRDKSFTSSNLV